MLKVQSHGEMNLLDCLRSSGILLESPCNGKGICGKCKVKILSGAVSALTEQEKIITAHNAHPLGAWHGTLQLRQHRIGVRRIHGHQQAAGGLGVIQHILYGDLRLSGIHPLLGKGCLWWSLRLPCSSPWKMR